jgi:hypothetical protein
MVTTPHRPDQDSPQETGLPAVPPKRSHRGLKIAGSVILGLLVLGVVASLAAPKKDATPTAAAPTAAVVPTIAPTAPSAQGTGGLPAEPEGKFGLASCDLNLDFGSAGSDLIGSTTVKNTGDVELTAEVTFAWLLGNGKKITDPSKSVTVKAGATKLVFFSHPASMTDVSLFQSHPDYFDGTNCTTHAAITK